MTEQKIKFSESESSGPGRPESTGEEVVDRLAGLLPEDALQDAPGGAAAGGDHRARRPDDPDRQSGSGDGAGRGVTEHLGYPPGQAPPGGAGNHRNGHTPKTLRTELGPVELRTPRDRAVHDDHIPGIGDVEALVDHQVVAGVDLDRAGGSRNPGPGCISADFGYPTPAEPDGGVA